MNSKDVAILRKILSHVDAILKYCAKYSTLEQFEQDPMCVEACVFNLMQIGELAKTSLSDDVKQTMSNILWNQIYGMRNRIVHGYDGVRLTMVWATISEDLPKLKSELEQIL